LRVQRAQNLQHIIDNSPVFFDLKPGITSTVLIHGRAGVHHNLPQDDGIHSVAANVEDFFEVCDIPGARLAGR
jgi:hypothetical protein